MRQSPWQKEVEKDSELLPSLCPPFPPPRTVFFLRSGAWESASDTFLTEGWARPRAAQSQSARPPKRHKQRIKEKILLSKAKDYYHAHTHPPLRSPLSCSSTLKLELPRLKESIQDNDMKRKKGNSRTEMETYGFSVVWVQWCSKHMFLNTYIVFLKNCKSQVYGGNYEYSRRLLELFD